MKVTVLGSLNVDYVMWADRLPTRGETVLGHTFRTFVGGKGANQAVQAALIGAEAYMVGRVGRDFMGEMVMESLRSKGVRTDLLVADPENPTGAACIYVDDGGDNYLMVVENANGKVGVPDVDAAMGAMRDSEALIVQNEIPLMTVAYAMEAARGMGKLAVLDPAPYKAGGHALFRHATVITPNETEAEAYSGVPQAGYGDPADWARAAAEGMRRLGAANVIITMADKGAFVSFGGLSEMVPAYSVDPVDSTAAGDSFNAALTMALAEGRPTLEAVSYACAAGALTASREGAQASLPTGEEIKAFIRTAKLKGG